MPKHGSGPSRAKSSGDGRPAMVAALALAMVLPGQVLPSQIRAQELRPYRVIGNAIPEPLTGVRGDPTRGRAIIVDRQKGLCLLCHTGPFPEQRFQGNLAPDLRGVGSRLSEGELRLRLVDSRQLDP